MKKFLTIILACTVGFFALAAGGCETEEPSVSAPVETVEKLELEKKSVVLTLGDTMELPVSYNEIEGGVLSWTSSAPDVVSVNANGVVEGLQVGSATVKVGYGSKEASCVVQVSLSGYVPTLAFDGDVSETLTILKGDTFGLGAHVEFNGKSFTDVDVEYFVADESVGTIVDGAFVAKNKTGSTQVNVFATWRGQTVHSKSITVNVIAESTVLLNGGDVTSVKLYTLAEHEGNTYATSQIISKVFISEDNAEIADYTLSVLDEGIASIEKIGEGWEIKALKSGKTSLLVSYGEREYPFDLVVERPVAEMGRSFDYSVADGKYFEEESKTLKNVAEMFEDFGALVSYRLDGKEYKAKDGAIDIPEGMGREVTFYNEYVGYKVVLNAYTMVIDELKDFEHIYAGVTETDVAGNFVLGKDVIEPDTVLTMPEGKVANNFAGTFDGRGHVLSFTFQHGTEHMFGLFGKYLKGATIKNVALNNITMDGTTSKNTAGIICGEGSDGKPTTAESTIENVFVDLKFSEARTDNLAFMGNAMWATIMKNVIIHVAEVPESDTYGSFARGDTVSVSNCYVVSDAPTYVTVTPTSFKKVPTLYADYAAMLSAGNDYSSFSAEFWDVTTYGIPVWKTLTEGFSM